MAKEDILQRFDNEEVLGKNRTGPENRNKFGFTEFYEIKELKYPLDVMSAPDLQHYMAFFINIRKKSKFNTGIGTQALPDVSTGWENRTTAATQSGVFAASTALAAGAVTATALKSILGGALPKKIKGKKTGSTSKAAYNSGRNLGFLVGKLAAPTALAATAGGLLAAGASAFSDALSTDVPLRISDAIILPIEKPPVVSYGMKYSTVDLGILGGLLGGSSAIDSGIVDRSQEAGQRLALDLINIPKSLTGLGPSPKAAALLAGRVATNPFKEVIFEQIEYRTYKFDYTFLPKSLEEFYNVKRIIDLFKFHMHPELSDGGLFYVYPSEFNILYYYRGEENKYMNKISTCVLEKMDVKYGGESFSSFDGTQGAPTEISMSLSFKELELLTKERIVKGY